MLKKILYLAVVSLVLCITGCRKTSIELGNDYTWKLLSYTSGLSVVVNSDDKIIIGPGGIDLWAKYPWIYGCISNDNGLFYWAINMETKQVIDKMSLDQFGNFRKKNNISDDLRLLATWGDVTVRDVNRNKNLRIVELKKGCTPAAIR